MSARAPEHDQAEGDQPPRAHPLIDDERGLGVPGRLAIVPDLDPGTDGADQARDRQTRAHALPPDAQAAVHGRAEARLGAAASAHGDAEEPLARRRAARGQQRRLDEHPQEQRAVADDRVLRARRDRQRRQHHRQQHHDQHGIERARREAAEDPRVRDLEDGSDGPRRGGRRAAGAAAGRGADGGGMGGRGDGRCGGVEKKLCPDVSSAIGPPAQTRVHRG